MEYRGMKYAKFIGGLVVAAAAMTASLPAWSAIAVEKQLGGATVSNTYWAQTHSPRIDMTNISLSYAGTSTGGVFGAVSTSKTALKMIRPDFSTFNFNGKFALGGTVSTTGGMSNGIFSFVSNDSVFGFGKDKYGKNVYGNVFSGKLTGFGWSESKDMIEFTTSNFSGWACNMGWCTAAERIKFNVANGSVTGLTNAFGKKATWSKTASGTAVIPVPAAAWLFGSGLVGLIGISKRRKN